MESFEVITRVTQATEWCTPIIVAKNKVGEQRICVDSTGLNSCFRRERIIMSTVGKCLVKFAGATWFSKLDARAGNWKAPLAAETLKYTTFLTMLGRLQFFATTIRDVNRA